MNEQQRPLGFWARLTRPLINLIFGRWIGGDLDQRLNWSQSAEAARIAQDPLRARALLHSTVVLVILLLIWSALAEVDEVTRGSAKVVPSRQIQIIQSLDGGIVSEILVKEGQVVEKGQLLVRIDETRFLSSLRENRSQYLALVAKAARLSALTEDKPFEVPSIVTNEAPDTAAQEQSLYLSNQAELNSSVTIARQQLTQREQELLEAHAYHEQSLRGMRLAQSELDLTEPLVDSGAVSEVEVLRLQREVSRLRGERDQAAAQITRVKAAVAEANSKIEEVGLEFRNRLRGELADTTAKLNGLAESSVGLSHRVSQAAVKSTVRGTISRLLVTTEGGVVLPGNDIVEIVPLDDTLLLEAKIAPSDIAFLRPGQPGLVKFTAYDFVVYGGLDAVVDSIGADTITDEKGNSFYNVRVRTDQADFGDGLPIIPGMVADVDIITGKKTILAYLMKPVLRAKQYALTER